MAVPYFCSLFVVVHIRFVLRFCTMLDGLLRRVLSICVVRVYYSAWFMPEHTVDDQIVFLSSPLARICFVQASLPSHSKCGVALVLESVVIQLFVFWCCLS